MGMGLTNHIPRNVIVSIFHHIPRGRLREEHRSKYKEIELDLIKSSQNTETNYIE